MTHPGPSARRPLAAAAWLFAAFYAEAARAESTLDMPRDISLNGWKIDELIHTTLVLITILFAIMVGWMAIACIFHGKNHKAEHTHGTSKQWMAAKLGMAGLVFFGVDGNLFYHSTTDLHEAIWNFEAVEADPTAVRIELNAHQWAWDARYPGPDGAFGTKDDIVSLNDLRVPEGVPVVFQLASVDVIHSLYIPNLRVKQDAVPGMINWAWFQAKETGEFEIACAQHCGTNHYKMRALLTVLPRAEFDVWAAQASENAARAYDEAAESSHWGWEWRKR